MELQLNLAQLETLVEDDPSMNWSRLARDAHIHLRTMRTIRQRRACTLKNLGSIAKALDVEPGLLLVYEEKEPLNNG